MPKLGNDRLEITRESLHAALEILFECRETRLGARETLQCQLGGRDATLRKTGSVVPLGQRLPLVLDRPLQCLEVLPHPGLLETCGASADESWIEPGQRHGSTLFDLLPRLDHPRALHGDFCEPLLCRLRVFALPPPLVESATNVLDLDLEIQFTRIVLAKGSNDGLCH